MEAGNQTSALRGNISTLVIMAKAPKTGKVKTRLAQSLPAAAVIELYGCLLDDTLTLARSLDHVDVVIMCPASDVKDLESFARDSVRVVAQNGEGLAAGLSSVFATFVTDGEQRIIAFNSDSPHLPVPVLQGAFDTLAFCDVVVGPTHDGGYYLVGAKSSHPELFSGNGMGTSSALETLMQRVRDLGLSVRLTDPFYDIDVASDLIRLDTELRQCPPRAPRTAAWLERWRQVVAQLRPGIGEL